MISCSLSNVKNTFHTFFIFPSHFIHFLVAVGKQIISPIPFKPLWSKSLSTETVVQKHHSRKSKNKRFLFSISFHTGRLLVCFQIRWESQRILFLTPADVLWGILRLNGNRFFPHGNEDTQKIRPSPIELEERSEPYDKIRMGSAKQPAKLRNPSEIQSTVLSLVSAIGPAGFA